MDKKEFTMRMKELGWSDEYIDECLRDYDEDERKGIALPLDSYLIEAPINY